MFRLINCAVLLCLVAKTFAAKFPDHFLFGAGTSAFQIEGAWNEDGKGPSLWDTFLHNREADENGDVACDSYHKWQEDVEHAKKLGLDFYRFSIAWSRILPNGTINNINQKGVEYYLNLIKALKAEGIEPFVTIYHWDMPQHIYDNGGFLNPQFVDYFEDYARLCYKLFAPYVKYWFTINEPTLVCRGGYGHETNILSPIAPYLPSLNSDGMYQCSYVLLKAHARAWRIYDEEFRPKYGGKVGIVLNTHWAEPATNSTLDIEASERELEFDLGWFANPVYRGNWPQVMIDRIGNRSKLEGFARSRLPQFTQEEIEYINGTHDFFALNTYVQTKVKHQEDATISYPDMEFDIGVNSTKFSYSKGLRKLVNYINDRYQPGGIMISENGLQTPDTLNDVERIDTLTDYLSNFLDAIIEDKVNIFGYALWSLMDNFEWGSYEKKFGIIRVDFDSPNRTRTWKDSAKWYRKVIETKSLDN